jgi:hypothetical protein
MSKGQRARFRNQELDDAIADAEWERFLRRRNKQ